MSKESNGEFVAVHHPKDAMQAVRIREALEQAGIICYVENENVGAIWSGLVDGVATTTVMVPRPDADAAKQIIEDLHLA